MPILETTGEQPHDSIWVRAVMHWPATTEEIQRRQYYVANHLNGIVFEPGPPTIELPVQAIQTLLHTPSWQALTDQVRDRARLGMQAGDILLFMFLMDRLGDSLPPTGTKGASLDKAFGIAVKWAQAGNTWGDGEPIARSEGKIKQAWAQFRPVAHLWAALGMNRVANYAPAWEIFHPEYLPAFLETAAYLFRFANEFSLFNKAEKSRTPLLDSATSWTLDPHRHRARMLFPNDLSVFDDAPLRTFLRQYSAS